MAEGRRRWLPQERRKCHAVRSAQLAQPQRQHLCCSQAKGSRQPRRRASGCQQPRQRERYGHRRGQKNG